MQIRLFKRSARRPARRTPLRALCAALAAACALALPLAAAPNAAAVPVTAAQLSLRIEGAAAPIYRGSVSFASGEDFYDILVSTLQAQKIPLEAPDSSYGHYIDSIGGETGTSSVYWHLYVNGASSDVGADSYDPKAGDSVVLYIGDDSLIHYPTVTVTPQNPAPGSDASVSVRAVYTDYSDYNNPVQKNEPVAGAAVTFQGKTYTTGADGTVSLPMPSAAGSYAFSVSKETGTAGSPAIVRTGDVALAVGSSSAGGGGTPGGGSSGTSAPAASTVSAALKAGIAAIRANGVPDWSAALALEAAGASAPSSYFATAKADLDSYGSSLTATHLAAEIIGLRAAGGDPRSFDGQDLVSALWNRTDAGKTGLNGYVYALLALDCGNYAAPAGAKLTRSALLASILKLQKADGGFALDAQSPADSDMTAMTLCALAPYRSRADVSAAVNRALAWLSSVQKSDGGFIPSYSKEESSESAAQVISALVSLGIDPQKDARFVKTGGSAVSRLLAFSVKGGFAHTAGGGADAMATEQAVQALGSLQSGKPLYRLAAVPAAQSSSEPNPATGESSPLAAAVLLLPASLLALLAASRRKKA